MEIIFDIEVRIEKVIKDFKDGSVIVKEIIFFEKIIIFVDDEGEKLDIKLMVSIIRVMFYGLFGLFRGYGFLVNKFLVLNYYNLGYAILIIVYFASISRLGVNRLLIDYGKFYFGLIRKVFFSG